MISIYICTFNQFDLALGAAKSLQINLLDHNYQLILMCGIGCSNNYQNNLYTKIIETKFLNPNFRRRGWIGALKDSIKHNNKLSVCIDDDIRLVSPISIEDRYPKERYVPENTFCVQIWRNAYQNYYDHLKVTRLTHINQCVGWNNDLASLAIKNWSERIDNVWLHIDKGSELMTVNRYNLIQYVDHKIYEHQ